MSVYIKGMEMPTTPVLFCIHPDGKVFADLEENWREYKAIPVPDHGRLKDYDQIMKEYNEWFSKAESREYESMFYALYRAISDSRTIIPGR